jgi:hypothetical protein
MADKETIWQQLLECQASTDGVVRTLFEESVSPITFIKTKLRRGSTPQDISLALALLATYPDLDATQVFPELVDRCVSLRYSSRTWSIILRMPRRWVISNIEAVAESFLPSFDRLEYSMLLGLYEELDYELARRLALRASASDDFDIKEVGEDFFKQNVE